MLIETADQADEFLRDLDANNVCYIAFDTEFVKRKTYYPIFATLQVNICGKIGIFDIQALHTLPNKLLNLFQNFKIMKICHAGLQDMQILHQNFNIVIQPCFDTQIAAIFSKDGINISYKDLVKKYCKKNLDKCLQKRDWSKRPFLTNELAYLHNDVKYLVEIYKKLVLQVDVNWVIFETQYIYNKQQNKDLLSKWRENLAKKSNIPESSILHNTLMHALRNLKVITFENIVKIIPNKQDLAEEILPILKQLKKTNTSQMKLHQYIILSTYVDYLAKLHRIPREMLCEHALLLQMIENKQLIYPLNVNWRYELFGKALHQLLSGTSGLYLSDSIDIRTLA